MPALNLKKQTVINLCLLVALLLVGLMALDGCSKNSANSNTANGDATPSPGAVVKNSIGMEFAYIPAGSFQMGSDKGSSMERPVHQVAFAKGFYMGRYEVTQGQWQKVMGNNPSYLKDCGENCPVDEVSFNDVQEFIKKLNAQNDGYTYHLPSEAEWEYACRAGTTGDYAGDLDAIGWYQKNSDNKTHPVGQKKPNAWGLYDMHGGVAEWTMDTNHYSYDGAPTDGSAWMGGTDPEERVVRGGSSYEDADSARSANRGRYSTDERNFRVGFRVVAVAQSK
jgi:formylglycine-generating enzyme required for sulfatase activity